MIRDNGVFSNAQVSIRLHRGRTESFSSSFGSACDVTNSGTGDTRHKLFPKRLFPYIL